MKCIRCNSAGLFQFSAGKTPNPPPEKSLPLVCRSCSAIMINGELVDLPEVLSRPIVELAEETVAHGKDGREGLEELAAAGPDVRIENYMAQFYRSAYLEGFFRALAYFRHNSKEGRIKRLRDLWETGGLVGDRRPNQPERRGKLLDDELYTEFEQLLHLSVVPGESNAKSRPNKSSSGKKDRA